MLKPEAARWFADRRGITKDTLEAFGISSDAEVPVIYPYPDGARKRRATLEKVDGKHRMWWEPVPAGDLPPFLPPDFERGSHMILVEGETDVMALWQNSPPEVRKHIVGVSGANGLAGALEVVKDAKQVMVVFDRDDPYENPLAVDTVKRAKKAVREELGVTVARFVELPQGINDVAEFFQRYDWTAFRVLLKKAAEITFPFKPLDLKAPLPDFDFLVDGLMLKGEIVMLTGDPGVGKSWLAEDLAVAMAEGRDNWLGQKLLHHGRVLYIDQENPLVTARQRLVKLGLTDEGIPNLHYLWFQGVRFDSDPDRFLEHAALWQPDLVVVDSLSRVHFKNENSAEDMNPILNASVYPLARELGATVMVIHHIPKEGKGPRGSSAIQAAMDLTLEVREQTTKSGATTGAYALVPDKLRNVPPWGMALEFKRVEDGDRIYHTREEEPY